MLDPGIGFGKTPEQSIVCIARLAEFKRFGLPLLVGASRKRFINSVTPSAPDERLGGSLASHLMAVENGAAIVRAHDVAETVQALRVAAAIESGAMSDRIFINGLSLHAYHGVMPHEAKVGQTFTIDLDARRSTCRPPRAPTRWRTRCPTTRWSNARARHSARSASG